MKNQSKTGIALLVVMLFAAVFTSCKKGENLSSTQNSPKFSINGKLPGMLTGLIAYWPLDGSGTDVSGNGNNGTLNSVTATADRFGNAGKACRFNGSSSYINVADNAALRLGSTDFSMNAWIKLDGYNSSYGTVILSKRNSGVNNGYLWSVTGNLSPVNGELSFNPGGGLTPVYGTAIIDTTQWHMVTSVYNSTTQQFSIYIDGVLDNVTNSISNPSGSTTADLNIGYDNITSMYHFLGAMDDLRIYNTTLSADDIEGLYDEPDPSTLIAYWPFDGDVNDYSGNAHNGTPNNLTSVYDRLGNPGGAYHFDGYSSFVNVPDASPLRLYNTNFTLNAWIKLDAYNSSYGTVIFSKRNGGINNGYLWSVTGNLSPVNGELSFNPGGGLTPVYGVAIIDTTQWHMVTSVYNVSTSQFTNYIDGTLDNVTNSISNPSGFTTADFNIGYDNISGMYYFSGAMDEVKIYGRAITPYAVKAIYNGFYK
jgi:hypothetical protein